MMIGRPIKTNSLPFRALLVTGLIGWFGSASLLAQKQDVTREFDFANALVDAGFKDYAKRVVDSIKATGAEKEELKSLFDAKLKMRSADFAGAQEILDAAKTDTVPVMKMRLQLANAYYTSKNDVEKASEIYNSVFDKYAGDKLNDESEEVKKFFMDSAYIYSSLMKKADRHQEALKAINLVIKAEPEDEVVMRSLLLDKANLLIDVAQNQKDEKKKKEFLNKSRKTCDVLFGGGIDLFFGKAISTLVRIELIEGNRDVALGHIKEYTPILIEIENILVKEKLPLSLSPLADLRYTRGNIYLDMLKEGLKEKDKEKVVRGIKNGYSEFLNVFNTYGKSEWGPKAAAKAWKYRISAKKSASNSAVTAARCCR